MSPSAEFTGTSRKEIIWSNGSSEKLVCRACGQTCEMTHVITTPNVFFNKPDVDWLRCPKCESLNAKTSIFTDYDDSDSFVEHATWVRHYLQVGAGIDFMIRPLQRTQTCSKATMIDVGCGFGFAVNYWNWAGGEGYGVEPSSYGKLGASILEKNIFSAYLSDIEELSGRTFDRVFSSEVIEHVDNVFSFCDELTHATSESGVVLLTTPSAGYVHPNHEWGMVVAALSPGLHRLLFSHRALSDLLKRAGFKYVKVQEVKERLVAYASRVPLAITENSDFERRSYLSYLLDISKTQKNPDLRGGVLFRAFKEQVNFGDFENGVSTFSTLRNEIINSYNIDLIDLTSVLRAVQGVSSLEEFGERIPFFTPAVLYYAAMISLNGKNLMPDPAEAFSASMALTEIGYRIAPDMFQEAAALYWLAKLHIAIAAISCGNHEAAQICLEEIAASDTPPAKPLLKVSSYVLQRAQRELGVVALQTDKPELAMGIFRSLIAVAPYMREDLICLHQEATRQAKDRFVQSIPS